MDENELVSFLGRKVQQAMNDEDGDISDVRAQNFELYVGKPYGNERDGYSSVVTREALEVVEWALPSILRVFTSSDRVVAFDPEGPEDEKEAEQQTDIANHYILKENNGFIALHHWFKDILMYPNGYIKVFLEEIEKTRVEHYQGLSIMGLQQVLTTLAMKGDAEVIEQSSEFRQVQGPGGVFEEEVYEVKIRLTWVDKAPRIVPVPPDELLVDNDCLTVDLNEADFICHRVRKSRSHLIREGYSPDDLDEAGGSEDFQWLDERATRLFYEDEDPDSEDEDDPSMRQYWVHECYVYVDEDEDGVAEHRRIVMIGAKIFEDEEIDYQPFVAASAIMIPHKHAGLSFIDVVKDIQEIKSTLWRQLLDNIYRLNVRRKYVGDAFISDEAGTIDILMDTMSEYVPARDPTAIMEEAVQPIVSDILPVIQGMNDMQNVRSGVAPNLSLDPNVLQQSTMGAFANALEQASQRIEMLVRVIAETGMKQLMAKIHQLLRQFIDRPKALKIRGEWVEFNPAEWHERHNATAHVGLGFNNKEQKMALLVQLLNLQREAIPHGLVRPDHIHNTLERLVDASGLGHISQFFVDPQSPEYQPPQPQKDPMVEIAMADLQIRQQDQEKDHILAVEEEKRKWHEMSLKYGSMELQLAELQAKLKDMEARTQLTDAQKLKTLEEARATDIENDANESGLMDLVNGG